MAKTIDDSESQLATATPSLGDEETQDVRDSGILEDLLRPCLVEFTATALFLFFTLGHVVHNAYKINPAYVALAGPNGTQSVGQVDWLAENDGMMYQGMLTSEFATVQTVGFSFGFMIFVLVYSCAHLSGANINPAVTCALAFTRRISLTKAVLYIACQCIGACVGVGLIAAIAPEDFKNADGNLYVGYNSVAGDFSEGGAFMAEAIGTGLLMFTVMAAIDSNQQKSAEHINVLAPFAIGVSVFLAHLMLIPVTNCSINPARSFGTSVVMGNWENHWVFWFGPIFGATCTAFIYDLLLDNNKDKANCEKYMKGPEGW